MNEFMAWMTMAAVPIDLFIVVYILTVKRQAAHPETRGADSEEPPGGITWPTDFQGCDVNGRATTGVTVTPFSDLFGRFCQSVRCNVSGSGALHVSDSVSRKSRGVRKSVRFFVIKAESAAPTSDANHCPVTT
jgi:hypothetical protein